MRTVIIWDSCGDDVIKYFIVDGDHSHLDGVIIGANGDEAEDELKALMYDDGYHKHAPLKKFPVDAVRQGAAVIVAGFLP